MDLKLQVSGPSKKIIFGLILALIIWQWPEYTTPTNATHGGTHMYALWDGGAAPSGWSIVTTYDGRFLRGDTAANALATGGSATHTPTQSGTTSTISSQRASSCPLLSSCSARPTAAHTHTVTVSGIGSANNLPAYRNLALIRYDNGFPSSMPAGAIVIFNSSAPSGWTRYSAQDGRMVRIDSSNIGATGGSDTHSHAITWPATSGAASGTANVSTGSNNVSATTTHTHSVSGPATFNTITAGSALPPYVEPILAKASTDTGVPAGMRGMFDADPGQGWLVDGTYTGQLLRPNASGAFSGTSQGSATHTHSATSNTSGTSGQTSGPGTGTGVAGSNHTHVFTVNFNADSNDPLYVNVVMAERLGFTEVDYRWYADSGSEAVTDPWDTPDIAQNTDIAIVPQVTNPPQFGSTLRLRVNFMPTSQNMTNNSTAFRLQYKFSTDGNCTTGTWSDVDAAGGTGEWRFAASAVADNTRLTGSVLSPSSDVRGNYSIANPTGNNPAVVQNGKTIEWDFHIQHNARHGTQYSFRVTDVNGVPFNTYTNCPTLSTYPAVPNLLRHGKFFRSETRQGYYWAD